MQDIYAAEEALFTRVMAAAVMEDTSPQTAFALAGKFGSLPQPMVRSKNPLRLPEDVVLPGSGTRDAEYGAGRPGEDDILDAASAQGVPRNEDAGEAWHRAIDQEGNPQWITLTLSRAELDAERDAAEKAQRDADNKAAPPRRPTRFSRKAREDEAKQEKNKQSQKTPSSLPQSNRVRPRPFRRTLRLLIMVALMAFAYHVLAKKGWVPVLW